ncbi:phosphotransferase [Tessaracoccus antarcticus]|uniref:Aminoglycoside phosphotransferase family protein n=1 Tax=Tessaracoccus antarcticus TaxID=2479848 RepID=A0A3M0G1A5_9ACTN|nr:phosphotransferase [Tessaracoccus antarcticus]RMB58398.1 aminoglycoside phosphotransferase family protein [Tessaracoccus antarcticus]
MDDGSRLLTSPRVGPLLTTAVEHAGGVLGEWKLDHVDTNPEQSTTATYMAEVTWPWGQRSELLGVSARSGALSPTDRGAEIFADGTREVAVWLYPNDPDLPGLPRAAFADQLAEMFNAEGVLSHPVTAEELAVTMIGYRPRRRAVVEVVVRDSGETFFIKVLRARLFDDVLSKHRLLLDAGVPAPNVAFVTPDHLMVTRKLPGQSLAKALFDPGDPCTAEQLVAALDAMPEAVTQLERRPPWSDAVAHYAAMVTHAVPELGAKLQWAVENITAGLAGVPLGIEATHGDFHEGQIRVAGGGIVGVLDVDTIGPGRRADDLACLMAHLSTIQRMNPTQESKVRDLLARWVPVFDQRVDPVELRLRTAAVVISLATGPYRGQEPQWRDTTAVMVDSAVALVRQVI